MEKRYYSAEMLESRLRELEMRHGMRSADFYASVRNHDLPTEIDPFDATVWADTYRELCRLRSDSPTGELQPVG